MKDSTKIALFILYMALASFSLIGYGLYSVWNHNIAGIWGTLGAYIFTLASIWVILNKIKF